MCSRYGRADSNTHMENNRNCNSQNNCERNKVGGIAGPHWKTYKATVKGSPCDNGEG